MAVFLICFFIKDSKSRAEMIYELENTLSHHFSWFFEVFSLKNALVSDINIVRGTNRDSHGWNIVSVQNVGKLIFCIICTNFHNCEVLYMAKCFNVVSPVDLFLQFLFSYFRKFSREHDNFPKILLLIFHIMKATASCRYGIQ